MSDSSETVHVSLGSRSYDVHIDAGLLASCADLILATGSYSSAALLTHPHLTERYAEPIRSQLLARGVSAHMIMIPSGERSKSLRGVGHIYSDLARCGIDRKGLIITIGGGVLGDLGGFAAATWLRGIPLIQVPTTLLAQVDASVGGKTGIDMPEGKNLVGAFHQPLLVIVDSDTLVTLPVRELRSGLAEVIKYGIIHDESLFAWLAANLSRLLRRDGDALRFAIRRSCKIKSEVVSADETEQGLRAILNFGHTVGHAIEAVAGYRRFKHGEAISIGMVSAALIGEEFGRTPAAATESIRQVLQIAGLPSSLPAGTDVAALMAAMRRDKKAVGGSVRFVLCPRIGCAEPGHEVPEALVRRALERHAQLATA